MRVRTAILAIAVFIGISSVLAGLPEAERNALIDLYNATDGPNWLHQDNWLGTPGTERFWYGVTCTEGNTHVIAINLEGNQLTGPLPASLGDLSELVELRLNDNQLSGTIPASLGQMSHLEHLVLSLNRFTGAIPAQLGNLASLLTLDMADNQLDGSLPPQLGSLLLLTRLNVAGNRLSGSIPGELGDLTALHTLVLSENQFTGPIPAELGQLANLNYLNLADNGLEGIIPPEIGNLTALTFLSLEYNHLSGPLPSELGHLAQLDSLFLNSNRFSGPLPAELADLTNLITYHGLDIRWNALYTTDNNLFNFAWDASAEDFDATMTLAPAYNLGWRWNILGGVDLVWFPIRYQADPGHYEIWAACTAGGPYHYIDRTTDKSASAYRFECLPPGKTFYFVIRTVTDPHAFNDNRVASDYSTEIVVTTPGVHDDLDGSGTLDAADLLELANYLAGNTPALATCSIAGDINNDFVVTAGDLTALMQEIITN